jgi:hypothetical protein
MGSLIEGFLLALEQKEVHPKSGRKLLVIVLFFSFNLCVFSSRLLRKSIFFRDKRNRLYKVHHLLDKDAQLHILRKGLSLLLLPLADCHAVLFV